MKKARQLFERVKRELNYYRYLVAHPRTPTLSKWLLGAAMAYFLSPIDLIPDAIPVLGQLDDLLIVPGLIYLALLMIPQPVKVECRSRLPALVATVALALVSLSAIAAPEAKWKELSSNRIAQLTAMLPEEPRGLGRPMADRSAWSALATNPAFRGTIRTAERQLGKPLPAWSDELYLDFSKTGNRPPGEKMMRARRGQLETFVWAECLENRGRFTADIARVLSEYLSEPTWTIPAHDRSLGSFHGTAYEVDLGSSAVAYELAQALWLMGDRIPSDLRARVIAELERRIFQPVRETLRTGNRHWWLRGDNNWNPVCLAGTVGAALGTLPTREERALFVAAAEHYSANYLKGFTEDGYCSEGMGYWNYGMINFVTLREHVWQATGGRLDLFSRPRVRNAALFGIRSEILDGAYPSIADCRPGSKPSAQILRYCSLALGLGLTDFESAWDPWASRNLVTAPMEIFSNSLSAAASAHERADSIGPRSWFPQAGLLICRPTSTATPPFAVALKGGHNNENHNHNDVGSFSIVLGGEMLMGDPGGPKFYNARTFSDRRYTDFKLFSSYGHPVPVIDGQMQRPGREAAAKVLSTDQEIQPNPATLSLDLRAAYAIPELRELRRTFIYEDGPSPSLTVIDSFAASRPIRFETAITTRSKMVSASNTHLMLTATGGSLKVSIDAGGLPTTVAAETIDEDCLPFARIAIRLNEAVGTGRVTTVYRPAAP